MSGHSLEVIKLFSSLTHMSMAFVYVTTFKMSIRHFKNITTTNAIVWCFEQELPLFVCILLGMKIANFMLM